MQELIGSRGTGTTVSKEPQVQQAVSQISSQIDRMESQIGNLANKISPVVRQEPCAPSCDSMENKQTSLVTLASVLKTQADRVSRLADDVRSLCDRIEL